MLARGQHAKRGYQEKKNTQQNGPIMGKQKRYKANPGGGGKESIRLYPYLKKKKKRRKEREKRGLQGKKRGHIGFLSTCRRETGGAWMGCLNGGDFGKQGTIFSEVT